MWISTKAMLLLFFLLLCQLSEQVKYYVLLPILLCTTMNNVEIMEDLFGYKLQSTNCLNTNYLPLCNNRFTLPTISTTCHLNDKLNNIQKKVLVQYCVTNILGVITLKLNQKKFLKVLLNKLTRLFNVIWRTRNDRSQTADFHTTGAE